MVQIHSLTTISSQEIIGAATSISIATNHTRITAFTTDVPLPDGIDYGHVKTVENAAGTTITISSLQIFIGGGMTTTVAVGTTARFTWIDDGVTFGWQVEIEPAQPDHLDLANIGSNTHAQIDTHVGSTSNPHSVTKAQVGLGDVEDLKVNLVAVVDPTVNDDTPTYVVGSRWFNISADREFVCLDNSSGAAVWIQTSLFPVGASITDNALVRWDTSAGKLIQNSVGILTDAGVLSGLTQFDLSHTATENVDHAVQIICDAAGFGDVRALNILYNAGTVAAGETETGTLIVIDESTSTGGRVFGTVVLSTDEGVADITALGIGATVNPILHQSGTFIDANILLNEVANVTVALSSGGGGNISAFVANSDIFTIGNPLQYEEMAFILDTPSSGGGIAPTFEFSTGIGTWTTFSPTDGTNGFRVSGVITWIISDISSWATGTGGDYLIRITRTRVTLSTTPILDLVQISIVITYSWDRDGVVSIAQLNVDNLRLDGNILSSTDTNGNIDINPDGTGAVNIGIVGAVRIVTIGNITGATALVLNSGTGNLSLTSTTTGNVQIQAGATGDIDLARGTLLHTSISTISTDAANKAIPLDNIIVEITTTTSADTANIPNGTNGQKITMIYVARSASSDELTITPATFASGNSITFTDLGGVIELVYKTVGGWNYIGADSIINGTGGGKTLDNYTYVSIDDTDSPYNILVTDNMIGVDPTVGSVIVNLPAISTSGKKIYVITDSAGTASSPSNEITINRGGSDLINGATSQTIIAAYNTLTLYNDNSSNWFFM